MGKDLITVASGPWASGKLTPWLLLYRFERESQPSTTRFSFKSVFFSIVFKACRPNCIPDQLEGNARFLPCLLILRCSRVQSGKLGFSPRKHEGGGLLCRSSFPEIPVTDVPALSKNQLGNLSLSTSGHRPSYLAGLHGELPPWASFQKPRRMPSLRQSSFGLKLCISVY